MQAREKQKVDRYQNLYSFFFQILARVKFIKKKTHLRIKVEPSMRLEKLLSEECRRESIDKKITQL